MGALSASEAILPALDFLPSAETSWCAWPRPRPSSPARWPLCHPRRPSRCLDHCLAGSLPTSCFFLKMGLGFHPCDFPYGFWNRLIETINTESSNHICSHLLEISSSVFFISICVLHVLLGRCQSISLFYDIRTFSNVFQTSTVRCWRRLKRLKTLSLGPAPLLNLGAFYADNCGIGRDVLFLAFSFLHLQFHFLALLLLHEDTNTRVKRQDHLL